MMLTQPNPFDRERCYATCNEGNGLWSVSTTILQEFAFHDNVAAISDAFRNSYLRKLLNSLYFQYDSGLRPCVLQWPRYGLSEDSCGP